MCYHNGAFTVTDGLGLGWQQGWLGSGWSWLCQAWGKLLAASQRSHPCSSLNIKTLPCKSSTTGNTIRQHNPLCQILAVCHFCIKLYFPSLNLWAFQIYTNLRDEYHDTDSINYFSMRGLKINIKIPVGEKSRLDHMRQYYCCLKGYNLKSVCIIWPLALISLIHIMLHITPIKPIFIN